MKKLILLLLLTITFVSCDTHSDPTIITSEKEFEVLNNAENINMTSNLYDRYTKIPVKGKKSYGYIDNGYYYFITEDNHYYQARLISNTSYITHTKTFFIIFVIFMFIIGATLGFFNSTQ